MLQHFPKAAAHVRKCHCRLAFRRAIMHYASLALQEGKVGKKACTALIRHMPRLKSTSPPSATSSALDVARDLPALGKRMRAIELQQVEHSSKQSDMMAAIEQLSTEQKGVVELLGALASHFDLDKKHPPAEAGLRA